MQKESNCQFIMKLVDMMDQFPMDIKWSHNGKKVMFRNIDFLEQEILPIYFRHANRASFIRQLNMYGFGKKQNTDEGIAFTHSIFTRGNQANFHEIKRRNGKKQNVVKQEGKFCDGTYKIMNKITNMYGFPKYLQSSTFQMLKSRVQLQDTYKKLKSGIQKLCGCFHRQSKHQKVTKIVRDLQNDILNKINNELKESEQINNFIQNRIMSEDQKNYDYRGIQMQNIQDNEIPDEFVEEISSNISFFRYQNDMESFD